MGRQPDPFITLEDAARILGRTPAEVNNLCNEGLMRRRSTGQEVFVHQGDVDDVRETNLHSLARPRDLIKKVLLMERELAALRHTVDIMGQANSMLSSSLRKFDTSQLVQLSEAAHRSLQQGSWTVDELLRFSEVFLSMSDADIVRLNDMVGTHDTWRGFYELCLRMAQYSREGALEESRDLETARTLLHRGLRNVRSIGMMFIENADFLRSSRELLEETMSHDLSEYDTLMKKLKSDDGRSGFTTFVQNS